MGSGTDSVVLAGLPAQLLTIEAVRRLGQALWMQIGSRINQKDLAWSRTLLGDRGDYWLWSSLENWGVIASPDYTIRPKELSMFLGSLLESPPDSEGLVWTLPPELKLPELSTTYEAAAVSLVDTAKYSLMIVSPYMEARGIGRIFDACLRCLDRGVAVELLAHNVADPAGLSAQALEDLRREAVLRRGRLVVYGVRAEVAVFVHSKVLVADCDVGLIGSANITHKGFQANLEVGMRLGKKHATEVRTMLDYLIASPIVEKIFDTQMA